MLKRRPLEIARSLGPGIIAGAADTDPTTVAALSVIGATTAYGLSWLVVLVIPMLIIVQTVSATVGVVARTGLEDAVRLRYGRFWALLMLLAVLAVNIITLAADLEGGAAALGLLTGVPYQWFVVPLVVAVGAFLIGGTYEALQRVLRYVVLVFLAFVVSAFLARPDWGQVLANTVIPHFELNDAYIAGALALLGTTLTSYAYVWETIEESAEHPPLRQLGLKRLDAGVGMAISGVIIWFIVIATGATLGVRHQPVATASDAAQALRPVAGALAEEIFGVGLLASAVLAIPVLAGTSAYVMAEAFGWRRSLDARFHQAPRFYIALVLSLCAGAGLTLLGIGPIQLLFFSSIAGGLGTPLTLTFLLLIARDRRIMGGRRIGRGLTITGAAIAAIVTLACAVYLWQTFL